MMLLHVSIPRKWTDAADTALPLAEIKRLAERITTLPPNFKVHPLVEKVLADRAAMGRGEARVDWGMGEHLAFASLVASGYAVRLSGEDSGRGTFTHRHSVLHDQNRERWDEGTYTPLQHVADGQAPFVVIDSILSEEAVLGFEYGYASAEPNTLVIWEAQFGDFANGAQVVIDQFLAAGESKWQRTCGIVLLLPHGYEGQGPEHSSARLERFLQLCAEDNIQVANLTTPAQLFHVLRRQVKRDFRKPLIVMSPKSLLRHPAAVSRLEDFTEARFEEILDDPGARAPAARLILCSGKVYYDLADYREKQQIADAAIVRVEQLYPLHRQRLGELAKRHAGARLVWCQEEPENMGAARWIAPQLEEIFGRRPAYAGRDAAASPAVGLLAMHRAQLAAFLKRAFTI